MRFVHLIILLSLSLSILFGPFRLSAQELGFGGLGAIDHSMAGATAALPLDGSGAMYWNPATLGALDHGELQIGFGRLNAPWYGDESVACTLLIPVVAVGTVSLFLLEGALDEDYGDEWTWWKSSSSKDDDSWTEAFAEGSSEMIGDLWHSGSTPRVRGFNMSFVLPPSRNRRWNVGLGISETGSRKIRFVADRNGRILGTETYRTKTVEFTPTGTWRFSRRFYVGFTPIVSFTEFPTASIPDFAGFRREASREHAGFGLQWGVYYETKRGINIGFSVRSPHWLSSKQQVRWIRSEGNILERELRYSTEEPMRYVLGFSYTGFEHLSLAIDVRHYDFQHLSSFYDVSGRLPTRRATSYAAGMQFDPGPEGFPMALRIGYQFTDSAASFEDYCDNTTPPIAKGHSIHYGVTFGRPSRKEFEMCFSLSHGFGSGRIHYTTASGRGSFRRNPNRNTFWWSMRYKF